MHALDPSDSSPLPALTLSRIGAWRILLGLLQGLLLYLLLHLLYRAATVRDKLAAGASGVAPSEAATWQASCRSTLKNPPC